MKNYIVRRDGEIMGMYYRAGDSIALTDAQARYLTAPLGSEVELAPPPVVDAAPAEAVPEPEPERRTYRARKVADDG